MIRYQSLFCKCYFKQISTNDILLSSRKQFKPQLEICPHCGAKGCCVLNDYYGRHIIGLENGNPTEEQIITVIRVICTSCKHTHAVLPDVIIPYSKYTLLFILAVLAERFFCRKTVDSICEKYGITRNTFYKWAALWEKCKSLWLGALRAIETTDKKFLKFLLSQLHLSDFTISFYSYWEISFLQSHKNAAQHLHRPPPSPNCLRVTT